RRHMVEVGLLGGERNVDVAELDRFLIRVVRKVAGDGVIRLAGLHQVHRDGGELGRRAALQEQDLVVLRNGEHAAQRRLGLLDDAVIYLGAVTHLHDGHAGTLIVQHFGRTSLKYGDRKHGRASGEVVNTIVSHSDSYLPFNNQHALPYRNAISIIIYANSIYYGNIKQKSVWKRRMYAHYGQRLAAIRLSRPVFLRPGAQPQPCSPLPRL